MKSEPQSLVTKLNKNKQSEGKRNKKNFQLIINYVPNFYTANQRKETENCEILNCNIRNNRNENIFKKLVPDKVPSNYQSNFKADFNINENKVSGISKKKIVLPDESSTTGEKVKVKKKKICLDKERSLLKQDLIKASQPQAKVCTRSQTTKPNHAFEMQECSVNDSKNSLLGEINIKQSNQKGSQKLKKPTGSAPLEKHKNIQTLKSKKKSTGNDLLGFDITKFKNIYELVEGLRKRRMISVSIWETLNAGLKEMNVDLLQEIINKRKKLKSGSYSPQLKAFALIIYFRQPGTFHFLAKICRSGWPSLNLIKEWKEQLNSHRRPNFVEIESKSENDVS